MSKLNYWNETWSLDEVQCPCDIHFLDYLDEKGVKGAAIFHFGTGNHHIVGLRTAEDGSNNAVLGITASPQEYDDYVELLIKNLGSATPTRLTSATSISSTPGCFPSSSTSRSSTSASSARPRAMPTAR